ncbi:MULTISPECIES: cytochrome P450 [unclassified Bradyrhizobium]|jgi:cytochrome P450/ferredoxin-NADP reductase|uniref:cytochrome P450/oxidoreductase n=2 Tax=Pseudomonadota TaxID=1224 RepID=UPI0003FDC84D|nr:MULTISPECIES: cytochrome P450 [unclassified Bradyrhizobium]MBK5656653.1 cytochrome P450/oxidoreductase [Rhizobium sp.]
MSAPSYDVDFYSDEFIREPWPHYVAMRKLGPLVWLPRHGNYALTRYQEVADCLRDPETFCSGRGVAADKTACDLMQGNSIASDGERHSAIRSAMAAPLLPGALEEVRPLIEALAEDLIDRLIEQGDFDVMTDLASHLPLTVVRDLVGLPDFGKENMLRWGGAAFDLLGIQNPRGQEALRIFLEQREFISKHAKRSDLKEGSWTRRIHELVDDGALSAELAPFCIRDYINPSLDTTISATGQLIWQLSKNPGEWNSLRERPDLLTNAVNEAVRLGAPIRSFSRHATRDIQVGDHTVEQGARVMVLYASANRDERVFDEPDTFRVTRNPKRHLGFGSGIHMCVGMHLAQLEMVALLKAMVPRVERIHTGEPTVALNNTIYAFKSLPARFERGARTVTPKSDRAQPRQARSQLIQARVVERSEIGDGIISLAFAADGDTALPVWTPGAHIDLHVRSGLVRQYSLTGRVGEKTYRIAVQKEAESRGGSVEIHRKYQVGSKIQIGIPRNHFPLNEDANSILLFSGGIGLTPLLAMAWRLNELGRSLTWHISARSRSRVPFARELDALPFRDKIVLHIDDEQDGKLLDAEDILRSASSDCHVYVCGPRGYMAFIEEAARRVGVTKERFHQEHFGAEIDTTGSPFTVVATRSGLSIEVGCTETILSALQRAGIEVETACQTGVCGTCVAKVIEGRPDHRDMVLTDTEKASNEVIAVCCSRSQSRILKLDL